MLVHKKHVTRVEFSERERVFPARVRDSCQEFLSLLVTIAINYSQASIIRSPSRRVSLSALGTRPLLYSLHFPPLHNINASIFWVLGIWPCIPLAMIHCHFCSLGWYPLSPFSDWLAAHYCVSTQWRIVIDALPGPGMEEGTILSWIQNKKTVIAFAKIKIVIWTI